MNTPGVLRSVPTGKGGGPDLRHPGGLPRRRPRRLARALRPLRADRSPVPGDVRRAARGARGRLPGGVRRGLPQPDALPRRGAAVDLDLPDRRPPRVARRPRRRRVRTLLSSLLLREPPPPPAPDASEKTERLRMLDELVAKLSPKKKLVLVLFEIEGLPIEEVAQDRRVPREHGLVAAALRARRADGDGAQAPEDDEEGRPRRIGRATREPPRLARRRRRDRGGAAARARRGAAAHPRRRHLAAGLGGDRHAAAQPGGARAAVVVRGRHGEHRGAGARVRGVAVAPRRADAGARRRRTQAARRVEPRLDIARRRDG